RHTRSLRDWSSDVCSSDLPDGECGGSGADDHDTAGEPDGDGGADGDVHGGGGRHGAAELLVAEERSEHFWGDIGELRDASDDERSEERRVGKECRSRGSSY